VEKGVVEEFNKAGELSFTHGAGDYFGECAFLSNADHEISCVAKVIYTKHTIKYLRLIVVF